MSVSVILRTRDEAPRLRLTLASLAREDAEVVVVDDGSTDATAAMITAAARAMTVVPVRHVIAQGRAAASNAGAAAATGDLLIFLDGDTLAGPGMVAAHRAAHADAGDRIGRGETWHLRCTRLLADPETGTAWPHATAQVDALPPAEREALRITQAQVAEDFAAIVRRAAPGIYPGVAPRRLHAAEMRALAERPDSPWLWAAASGSNFSVPRDVFDAAGGFDPALDINEHRELAYRMVRGGARMVPVTAARTFHMIHRSGWRDPLTEDGWEGAFRRAHPDAPLDRLKQWWQALSRDDAAEWIDDAA
jgi:glycosyltransferase involved in cell wall biosynthesis